jgi:hypothetical protein
MDSNRALDDLKVIRQVMERTVRSAGGFAGQQLVLWGIIWFIGFLGNQYLPQEMLGWFWFALTGAGAAGSAWIGVRQGRRQGVRLPIWQPVALYLVGPVVFVVLIVWLFGLDTTRDVALLIVLTVAMCYFQVGVFYRRSISVVGAALAALAVGATVLLPDYFFLVMAFLSGGLLVGSGLWFMRRGG